ncbi:TonB-dependent siderophore receptor [Xanthomonas bundabergensis]|uniref:TonB-dependent siderophore receptor n=1 Tax=Xanthomonas bundabergensis TaxID=3160842 RepID=UPI003519196E
MTATPVRAVSHSLPRRAHRGVAVSSRLSIALALALLAPHALAADSDGTQVTDLNSVEVTAKKQKERVQNGALGDASDLDTPFSVSTVDAEQLEARQAKSLMDVFSRDASVSRSAGSDYNGWASRLIVRGLPLSFEDSMKVNGQPTALFGVNLPLEAMEQVQLLKGASGFMYGFGQPGGIVNYITKKPPADGERIASVDVGYRSDSIVSEHVDLGGWLGQDKDFGYRMNAVHEAGDFYSGGHIDRNAFALSLVGKLTPAVTWTADLLYQDRQIDAPTPYFYPWSYPLKYLPDGISGNTNYSSPATLNHDKFTMLSTGLAWEISQDWKASLSLGYLKNDYRLRQEYFELDGADGYYDDWVFNGLDLWTFKYAQALLEGGFATGAIGHRVVVGAAWQEMQESLGNGNLSSWDVIGSGYLSVPVRFPWNPTSDNLALFRYSDVKQLAGFASDTLTFSPHWSLLLGARFTDYTQTSHAWGTGVVTSIYKKPVWTPTVALLFKPGADSTLYASYVKSLEQGGSVGNTFANAGAQLDPLQSTQYELGYKIEKPRWQAAAALFRIDRGAEYANADNVYVQNGNLRYDGLELEGRVQASERLGLGASLLLLDAYYQQTSTAWLVDKQLEGTARLTATLDADYQVPGIDGLALHSDLKWFGRTAIYNNTAQQTTVYAKGYAVVNAGAGYQTRIGGRPVTFRAEVQNLFDRAYWQGGYYEFAIGAPRTYAANVKIDF